jgi:hypothetical protein
MSRESKARASGASALAHSTPDAHCGISRSIPTVHDDVDREPVTRERTAFQRGDAWQRKGKIVWKSRKRGVMSTIRWQKPIWSCSCRWAILGNRWLRQQDFMSVDRLRIGCRKRSVHGEMLLSRMGDMGIQQNYLAPFGARYQSWLQQKARGELGGSQTPSSTGKTASKRPEVGGGSAQAFSQRK